MRHSRATAAELYIAVEVGENLIYWSLNAAGATAVMALPANAPVFRVTHHDLRIVVHRNKDVRRNAKLELQAEPSIVPGPNAVYATPADLCWVDETNRNRAIPGGALVDAILTKSGSRLPAVVGVHLEGEPSALVLWAVMVDRSSSPASVVINPAPDEIEQRAREVAAKHNIAMDVAITPLDSATLFSALSDRRWQRTYSLDSEWRGVPVSSIKRLALVAATLGAAATSALAVYEYTVFSTLQESMKTFDSGGKFDLAMKEEISTHIVGYARLRSVDVSTGIKAAQYVWRPGVMVALTMERGKPTSLIVMHKTHEFEDRETKKINTGMLEEILRQPGPPGFSEGKVRLTGTGVGYEIEYTELAGLHAMGGRTP